MTGVPEWIDPRRLLTDSPWSHIDGRWVTELTRSEAADLQARLRGVALGGRAIEVQVRPSLKRALVRSARTADARRRRQTTPGFTRRGTRLDDEGKMSLTAEAIALELGERAAGQSVLDCCGGCGGNAIGFARAGCEVTLVEPNAKRIEMARHNARLYGVEDRIRFVRATAQEVAASETADLLFADPPWGSDWNRAGTGTSDLPLLGTLLELADRFEHTWLCLLYTSDAADE